MAAMHSGNFYKYSIADIENINQPILEESDFKDQKHRIIFTSYIAEPPAKP